MKVLLDSCVWGGAKATLATAGHDAVWSGDWDHDPGDEQILGRAIAEGRVLVTLDKDFGELAIVKNIKHAGIVRLVGLSAMEQGSMCVAALEKYSESLGRGAILTVEVSRVRVRESQ